MAPPKTSLWQPTPYPPSQLFLPIPPVHTTHIPVLDVHVTVSLTTHGNSLTLNLAVTGQPYLPFPTENYTTHGPVSDNVLLSASSNLTVLTTLVPTTLVLQTPLPPSVPIGFSGTAQIIAPIRESSFSVGPMHIHASP